MTGPGAVIVDLDGTLAPMRRDPAAVRLSPAMRAALAALARRRPVAVVSGRPLAFLEGVAGGLGLMLVGSHGAETRELGRMKPPARVPAALERVVAAAARAGLRTERKPFGRSIHVRELPKPRRRAALAYWTRELGAALPRGWELVPGNLVIEARPAGVGKGAVLAPLRKRYGRVAVALGDDVTDEDMFRALAPGELSVLVGGLRPSGARYCLAGIAEVRRYLAALAA